MTLNVTAGDVLEIELKLASNEENERFDGVRLLNTWLEGERSIEFCNYLSKNSQVLKTNDTPQSKTWAYLVKILTTCISLEISSSKERLPKLSFAKTLRNVVQRAHDAFPGKNLFLLPVAELIFDHVWDVLKVAVSLSSEYSLILQHLLANTHYRFHMRTQVYADLVSLHIKKVEEKLSTQNISWLNSGDDVYRLAVTLQLLLQSPPGDIHDDLREEIIKGFLRIISYIQNEGKVSRKLLECINTFLVKDGPNLGDKCLDIYDALKQFFSRCWVETRDCSHKDSLVLYAKLQLSLIRSVADGTAFVEQLMSFLCKELDQMSSSSTMMPRDEKLGSLTSSQYSMVKLAALVFSRACSNTSRVSIPEKQARLVPHADLIKERLVEGKWPWYAVFFFLIDSYSSRLGDDLFMYWFENISANFKRMINTCNSDCSYDGLLWILRSLQKLSSSLLFAAPSAAFSRKLSAPMNEVEKGWHVIWSCIMDNFPAFINVSSVVDAALMLLGNILMSDTRNSYFVSLEFWDLQVFKCLPSISVLCFISCYFSRRASQCNPQDALCIRHNMLRAVLAPLSLKEYSPLDASLIVAIPAAAYALCVGSTPLLKEALELSQLHFLPEDMEEVKTEEQSPEHPCDFFECSVEFLTKIEKDSSPKVNMPEYNQRIKLSRSMRNQLVKEMEDDIIECMKSQESEIMLLSDVINRCALLSNVMYASYSTSVGGGTSGFFLKLTKLMLELLERAISVVETACKDIVFGGLGFNATLHSMGFTLVSFQSFANSPFIKKWQEINSAPLPSVVIKAEKLLEVLADLYEKCSWYTTKLDANPDLTDILDICSEDDDPVPQLTMILSIMSSFFAILPSVTWETLSKLKAINNNPKVSEYILSILCRYCHVSSDSQLLDLVGVIAHAVDVTADLKFQNSHVLSAICGLVESLLGTDDSGKQWSVSSSSKKPVSEVFLVSLGDLVKKVVDKSYPYWFDRIKIINCICNFISFHPEVAQSIGGKLVLLLQDPDYRVRCCLAERISVLFQACDDHCRLFHIICTNFSMKLVNSASEKIVKAEEVLAAGSTPGIIVETTVKTLLHLVLHSDRIELEAVFMICAVAAIEPSQRELVRLALDSISKQLSYTNRVKYMEELMGPILFKWVTCEVSLTALVQTRELFVLNIEAHKFVQHCGQWLLPALILLEDDANLKWMAETAQCPCADFVILHYVHIISVCMASECSNIVGCRSKTRTWKTSILKVCGITEGKRDELIKKHMVSILKHIISLASMDSEPQIPLFSKDTIARAIQTAMRDFMDSEAGSRTVNPANKIHILTPNEVFQFLVSIHYRAAVAAHHRHKYNHLVVIGVFVDLLGPRSCRPSIFIYLLNLIGQFIDFPFLTDQCCDILSKLLKASNDNPSPNTTRLLGEQLQYLVSKLVDCCIRFESCGMLSSTASSQAFLLLQQLVTGSEASLHEYIKELGPFPEIDIFDGLRQFHSVICSTYSPRAHLLNLVKRASHVPSRFLLGSLKALHKQLLKKGMHLEEENNVDVLKNECWHSDGQIVQAAWGLVEMCSLDDANNLRSIVIDLICRAGIGDPHGVVFRLPGESPMHAPKTYKRITDKQYKHSVETAMSEKSLLALMILLKKCLMDESVEIIDKASHALCGILSSMNGNKAFNMLDPYEMSLIEAHSGGVDLDLVKESITNLERKFSARPISIEDSTTWTTSGKTFDEWICPLVYAIINYCDDPILRLCQDIVLAKSEVAELLFINAIVDVSKRDPSIGLCKIISSKVQENIFTESNALIKSVQIFLRALNELRLYVDHEFGGKPTSLFLIQKSKRAKVPGCEFKSRIASVESKNVPHSGVSASINWNKVYWLDVDYLLAANFAVDCGSYLTAVLYVELWCEEHFKSLSLGTDFYRHEKLQLHIEILLSAVTQINEPDSLYGLIQSPKLTSQIVTFEQEGNWGKALEYYDMKMRLEPILQIASSSHSSLESSQLHTGLIRSLKQTGCNHVLGVYCQGLASQRGPFKHDSEFTELQYEAAWRAGNWDFCPNSGADAEASYQHARGHHFHQNLHSCFRAFQEGEFDEFHARLQDSKQDLLLSICHASQESTQFIHSTTIKLQIFYHLGMAWDLRWSSSHEKTDSLSELTIPGDQLQWLHGHWRCILKQAELHLDVLEPLIAFRRVLLQALNSVESTLHHLLESASILRKGSRFSQSAAALFELKSLCSEGDKHSNMYWLGRVFEESKLYHAQGQHEMAINLADHISQTNLLKPSAPNIFTLIGKWRAETRSSNSRIILDKYLQKAIDEDNNATNKVSVEKKNQMHFQLAHYVDGLFRNHEERLNSKEWQIAESLQDRKEKEIKALANACKSVKGNTTEYLLMIQQLQKQVEMGKEEKDKLEQDMDKLLCSALEGYKRCLIIGEKYDVRAVFRLVSLWFRLSNRKIVVDCMRSTIKEVQSYKFLLLVYQIVSRLGADTDSINFQRVLASLVMKMALDHPYHTLYQLIALTNGDRIKPQQKSKIFFVADMCTKFAAESLLKEISQRHGVILHQMQRMIEVYIKVAELEMNAGTNGKILLPAHLRDLGPFEHVPVITYDVPVDRTCQYPESSFPHFKGMSSSITVGGINAPKLVECFGSDGNKYLQLSKSGNDDLRQDAVMEQLFGLVNTFLLENNDTRKRRLKIRTYKVVPLTPSAGVLEWVNGTSKLSEYLIGRTESGVSGAHGHYGVGDWEFKECRKHMTEEADKRKAFEKVCQNFRPVMHYFFLERFSNPAVWFEKRNAYTRSVAASSMVGYIVGLGDRHLGNILIDETTAEVVHIDLGIAFEQGLLLRTPERVPFRLTRDIVDGMGVTGVEGVFRRCCEETLSVMRRNKEALLTIIEVFIHDPLYKWALSPLKALLLEKVITNSQYDALDDSDEGNRDAVRALTRVKQKLDGYEDGEMRSVKGQVQQLIQDATDPDRLCTIYVGWASWV